MNNTIQKTISGLFSPEPKKMQKRGMKAVFWQYKKHMLLSAVFGICVGWFLLGGWLIVVRTASSFIVPQTTVLPIDPYTVALRLTTYDGSIALIDIRSTGAYDTGHILHAVNIPVVFENQKMQDEGRIINKIRTTVKGKKDVVFYGNTRYDEIPYTLMHILQKKGIQSRVLAVGWNEWRHARNLWLPQEAWDTVPMLIEEQ